MILKRYLGHLAMIVFDLIHFLLRLQVIFADLCPSMPKESFAILISMKLLYQKHAQFSSLITKPHPTCETHKGNREVLKRYTVHLESDIKLCN